MPNFPTLIDWIRHYWPTLIPTVALVAAILWKLLTAGERKTQDTGLIVSLTNGLRTNRHRLIITRSLQDYTAHAPVHFIDGLIPVATNVGLYMDTFTKEVGKYRGYIAVAGELLDPVRVELGRTLWEAECDCALARGLPTGLLMHRNLRGNSTIDSLAARVQAKNPQTADYYDSDLDFSTQLQNVVQRVWLPSPQKKKPWIWRFLEYLAKLAKILKSIIDLISDIVGKFRVVIPFL